MKTAAEHLKEWRDADQRLVGKFNDDFSYVSPPLEAQVSFLRTRLLNVCTALSVISEALIEERRTDNGTPSRE